MANNLIIPTKAPGDDLYAKEVNALAIAAGLSDGQRPGPGMCGQNWPTGIRWGLPNRWQQRIVEVTGAYTPPGAGTPTEGMWTVKFRYYDGTAWQTEETNVWVLDANGLGISLEIGDKVTAYWDSQRGTFVPTALSGEQDVVLVRNDTGGDRGRFEVVGIDGSVADPFLDDDDGPEVHGETEFLDGRVLSGVCPIWPKHDGKFGVLMDDLEAGKIGPVRISGLTPVRLWFEGGANDRWFRFADIQNVSQLDPASCWQLVALPKGKAMIQSPWYDGSSGFKYNQVGMVHNEDSFWGLVNLGNPEADVTCWGKALYATDPGDEVDVDLWEDTDNDGVPDQACSDGRRVTARAVINTPTQVPVYPDFCSVTWDSLLRTWWAVGCATT